MILQQTYIETLDNLKNVQNSSTSMLDVSSSTELLKVSDTTLESSSCDDGKYNFIK